MSSRWKGWFRPMGSWATCSGIAILLALGASCGEAPPVPHRIRVAGGETANFADLPTLVAQRRLASEGYTIELKGFAQAELAVEAMARGDADVSFGAMATYWAAAMRGAPVVTVMEQSTTRHVIVARRAIESCRDFQDKTVAVNSLGATGGNLFRAYVAEECPGTEARMLVMPRPSNRAAALLAGGIDAAVVLREHAIRLARQSDGALAAVEDLAERWPDVATNGMFVNRAFARRDPRAVEAFIRVSLEVVREIGTDPIRLAEAARREFGDEPHLASIAQAYARAHAWDPAGGLTRGRVDATVEFLERTKSLTAAIDPAVVVDRSFLERVVASMDGGRD
jgi:ABC-type nitrate/sulfonate/bicarbonate transport system substrate-binding protein